jgi:murein DD-endopeptidase MepM/ murein hydrolase activator NlpD
VDRVGQAARIRLARAGALAGLALSGIVAAFATIAPVSDAELVGATVAEPLEIHPAAGVLAVPGRFVREERFQRGDTLAQFLSRLGLDDEDAHALSRLGALRGLRPGIAVDATLDSRGALQRMDYLVAHDTVVVATRGESGFSVRQQQAQFETRVAMKSSVIQSSLFAAADAAGIPDAIAIQIADIFGGDIDFHRDLRHGDRVAVMYETLAHDGLPVRSGRVLAVEFRNRGKTYRAVWHAGEAGGEQRGGYYTPEGDSLRKAFLRSPLEFSRISSGFGMRLHPFLKSWRWHRGIDYAAPIGTRVRAVGDGVVEFAGRERGYGNVVILRHRSGYSTVYGHLNRFASGVHRGARVAQGETIGFVGMTGWATGPHLHYEFRIAGKARNPLAVVLPAGRPLPAAELPGFRRQAQSLVASLDLLSRGPVASLE